MKYLAYSRFFAEFQNFKNKNKTKFFFIRLIPPVSQLLNSHPCTVYIYIAFLFGDVKLIWDLKNFASISLPIFPFLIAFLPSFPLYFLFPPFFLGFWWYFFPTTQKPVQEKKKTVSVRNWDMACIFRWVTA